MWTATPLRAEETTTRPPDTPLRGADSPDRMNVSMPSAAYSRIRAATVCGSPTSAVPAPCRTRPTPAHRFGAISSACRVRTWPLAISARLTPLTLRVEAREVGLGPRDGRVVQAIDQPLGLCPRLGIGRPHDDVQADPVAQRAPESSRAAPHVVDLARPPRRAARPTSSTCRRAARRSRARPPTSRRSTAAGTAAAPMAVAASRRPGAHSCPRSRPLPRRSPAAARPSGTRRSWA